MDAHVAEAHRGAVAAVMFNLGYLPGGRGSGRHHEAGVHARRAGSARCGCFGPAASLTAVLYPGHPGGTEEADAVAEWAAVCRSDAVKPCCTEWCRTRSAFLSPSRRDKTARGAF